MTEAQRSFAATNLAGTQKMRRSEIRTIRTYNTNFLCLHYQLAVGCGAHDFIDGDAWTSDWATVNSRESWFLHNGLAQRVNQTAWDWDVMDVTYSGGTPNTGFPQYWITTCLARITSAENDGVFADSFTIDGYTFGQCSPTQSWFEDTGECTANWIPSLNAYGAAIRDAFAADGRGYKFLPNLGGLITGWDTTSYGVGDGGMVECFAFMDSWTLFDPLDWELQMDRAIALVRSNKIVICQSYPETWDYTNRMFATASYLLIKGSRTYLSLLTTDDLVLEYYPEYTINLGGAASAPTTIDDLWYESWGVYRRDYTNGIVLVNPDVSPVTIANLGATYSNVVASGGGSVNVSGDYAGSLSSTPITSLTMPPYSGAILLH